MSRSKEKLPVETHILLSAIANTEAKSRNDGAGPDDNLVENLASLLGLAIHHSKKAPDSSEIILPQLNLKPGEKAIKWELH